MRGEKNIKENLNAALSENAPDILANILNSERIEDNLENDLRNEPLFLDEVGNKRKWIPAGVVTCTIALLLMITTIFIPNLNRGSAQMMCTITFDVNPSLDIQIDKNGNVKKVVANNKDGEKIAHNANKKIKEDNSCDKVVGYIAKQLIKEGYLEDEDSVMLVSTNKEEKSGTENLNSVRQIITDYKKDNEKKFVAVYQEYDNNKKVQALAEEKGISNGKAAYCIKVSEKTDKTLDELCEESLYQVTSELLNSDAELGDEISIDEDVDTEAIDEQESDKEDKEGDKNVSNEEETSEEGILGEAETKDKEVVEELSPVGPDETVSYEAVETTEANLEAPSELTLETISAEEETVASTEEKVDVTEPEVNDGYEDVTAAENIVIK